MPVTIDGTTGITSPAIDLTTPLVVADGGTGTNTLTANNVILGNGTSAVAFVAPGSNGNLLTSNGTTWTSAAPPAGGVTSLNGQTGAITNTGAGNIGSYFVGSTTASGTTAYAAGATVAGSSLIQTNTSGAAPFQYGNASSDYGSAGFSGTWRNMAGRVPSGTEYPGDSGYRNHALWVRIS